MVIEEWMFLLKLTRTNGVWSNLKPTLRGKNGKREIINRDAGN